MIESTLAKELNMVIDGKAGFKYYGLRGKRSADQGVDYKSLRL